MTAFTVTPELLRRHKITPDEWVRAQTIVGPRDVTFAELGVFSALWSEHCSYKSSRVHLKGFPTKAPWVLQGPGENAGVIDVGDGWAVSFKVESHNHPSAIEPYEGAATGVGGILRDVFTMGARCIAILDGLFFGTPEAPRMRFLAGGVVSGIAGYGNCMGVPTVGGQTWVDAGYNDNILVNAMAVGLLRADRIFRAKAEGVGNPVLYVGARTGRDGIHGATMASDEFTAASRDNRPTVQKGDPFIEKLLMEACLDAFASGAVVAIQDMGAAGLTSSSFEMAARGECGVYLDLDRIPAREPGMTAYELMLSESQERMLLVAAAGREAELTAIFARRGLEAVVVGHLNDDGYVTAVRNGVREVHLNARGVVDGGPMYERPYARPAVADERARLDDAEIPPLTDAGAVLTALMGSPNIGSRRRIWERYDHQVGTNTVLLPGHDAAVLRIKGTRRGIAVSLDVNPRFCLLDPREGSVRAVAEGALNVACSGARPLAITDCLNFANPEKPGTMWQFVESVQGLAHACRELGTPVVSGNVSLYNETEGRPIPPTPTIGTVGVIDVVANRVPLAFQRAGDEVFVFGEPSGELAGSEYLSHVHGLARGSLVPVDLAGIRALTGFLAAAAERRLLKSAHDVSLGGLAVTLAESALAGDLGASVDLDAFAVRADALLFGERPGVVVVSAEPGDRTALLALSAEFDVPGRLVGAVGGSRLVVRGRLDVALTALNRESEHALDGLFGGAADAAEGDA